jgi:hypothetical protein
MLLYPRGFCAANQAKPGTQKFRSFAAPLNSHTSAKLAFPLQPHRPPLFCLISAEAVSLTGGFKNIYSVDFAKY